MNWDKAADHWPNAQHSRFVEIDLHTWFVQEMGDGQTIILLHGAGGSSHSWRDIMPLLSSNFHVITIDLPGQGFTKLSNRGRCDLDSISADIAKLLRYLNLNPFAIVGHSAGSAIAFRIALDRHFEPEMRIVSLNGALGHFKGLAGVLFPMMAKLLAQAPFVPSLFAKTANVDKLISNTGSTIDEAGLAQYRHLIRDPEHVDATLSMMSQWSLDRLLAELPKLTNQTLFIAGKNDLAVPPETSERWSARMPHAIYQGWDGLGHLMHEEAPKPVSQAITKFLQS